MTISSTPSVIIAGSGPTGLVLALALSINGISVRLIDRELDYRVGSKGAGIMPRAMEMYRFLGVLDDIKGLSSELVPMRRYQADGRRVDKEWDFVEVWPSTPDFPYGETLILAQDVMERVLRESLQRRFGVVVELGTELVDFEQSSEHVVARLKRHTKEQSITSEETVYAQYLVGTDGGRSTVRKGLGLEFAGETRSKDCWIYGDVELTGLSEGVWHMFGDMSTKTILFRPPVKATPNRWAVLAAGRDNENPDQLGSDHEAFEQYVREVTNRDDIKISRYHYLTAHRPNIRMCRTFGEGGRVFIAGDAAHTHPATGGQGLNSSVQDSFNLGWKLASVVKGLSSPKLLETYSAERVPVIEEMLARTTALFEGAVKIKDTVAAREDVSAWKRPRILQQLGIHYEWSPIVYDDRFEGGRAPAPLNAYGGGTTHEVRAGDRAPDAPALEVAKARGTITGTVALFDIYDPTKHIILLFVTRYTRQEELETFFAIARQQPAGLTQMVLVVEKEYPQPEALEGSDTVVIDAEGHGFKSYGITDAGRAAVVRPDGIVGTMVGSADGLSHYFGLVFNVTK